MKSLISVLVGILFLLGSLAVQAQPPFLSQRDPQWANIPMGNSGPTIGSTGCVITDMCMLFGYETSDPDDPIPPDYDTWVYEHGGYSGWNLIWTIGDNYDGEGVGVEWYQYNSTPNNWTYLDQQLAAGRKVLVKVLLSGSEHWVLVYKRQGASGVASSYYIADPWDYTFNPNKTLASYGSFQSSHSFSGAWSDENIVITFPTAGSVLRKGHSYTITWTWSGSFTQVFIHLYKYGAYWMSVAAPGSNTGSYTGFVPGDDWEEGQIYQIGISAFPSGDPSAMSGLFYVAGDLDITYPNGGETLYVGQPYTITWDHNGFIQYVFLHLYKDELYFLTIAAQEPNDGHYEGFVPQASWPQSSSYKLAVGNCGSATLPQGIVSDFSDGSFQVASSGPQLDVELLPTQAPPIYIPPSGGSFTYHVQVANNGASAITTNVWLNVTKPNGQIMPVGPVFTVPIPANTTLLSTLKTQTVPSYIPAGTYHYNGYIGPYPNYQDMDSFDVIKTGSNSPGGEQGDVSMSNDAWDGPPTGLCWRTEPNKSEQNESPIVCRLWADPNPLNPSTTLTYSLPAAARVRLSIYDIRGRMVASLVDGYGDAGVHEAHFDASGLPSGIYCARLEAGSRRAAQKLMLLK
jgi:hypothetical protein